MPDSRNIPVEFAEARWPFRVERLGLAVDSGGPGEFRGGLGYDKHIRMLRDAHFMSIADRSILSCWGVNGGRAGRPFRVDDRGRAMEGLVDDHPVRAGEVIRIRTTGGGGWGEPLTARRRRSPPTYATARCRPRARARLRRRPLGPATTSDRRGGDGPAPRRACGPRARRLFFDRGPGYPTLSGGRAVRRGGPPVKPSRAFRARGAWPFPDRYFR